MQYLEILYDNFVKYKDLDIFMVSYKVIAFRVRLYSSVTTVPIAQFVWLVRPANSDMQMPSADDPTVIAMRSIYRDYMDIQAFPFNYCTYTRDDLVGARPTLFGKDGWFEIEKYGSNPGEKFIRHDYAIDGLNRIVDITARQFNGLIDFSFPIGAVIIEPNTPVYNNYHLYPK